MKGSQNFPDIQVSTAIGHGLDELSHFNGAGKPLSLRPVGRHQTHMATLRLSYARVQLVLALLPIHHASKSVRPLVIAVPHVPF